MKALLIEWNPNTGKRAGNIDPDDPKLQCYGWQNSDVVPALEVRVIEDDRDASQYDGIKGVTVLHNDDAIQAAIDEICKPRYSIDDETLFKIDIEQRGIKLANVKGKDSREQIENLAKRGVKGIRLAKRLSLAEVYGSKGGR